MNGLFQWLSDLLQKTKFWVIVQPWERAVRTRLGKHVALLDAGCHLRIPIIDTIHLCNDRLRVAQFPSQTLTTRDGKTITIAGNIGFRIVDPLKALMAIREPESTVAAFAQAAVAEFITVRHARAIDALSLADYARAYMKPYAPGIEFDFVRVVDFAIVPTFRLLQESWRPSTAADSFGHGTGVPS